VPQLEGTDDIVGPGDDESNDDDGDDPRDVAEYGQDSGLALTSASMTESM